MKKREFIIKAKMGYLKNLLKISLVIGALTFMVSCFDNNDAESKILLDSLEKDSVELKQVIDTSDIVVPDSNEVENSENDSVDVIVDEKGE